MVAFETYSFLFHVNKIILVSLWFLIDLICCKDSANSTEDIFATMNNITNTFHNFGFETFLTFLYKLGIYSISLASKLLITIMTLI